MRRRNFLHFAALQAILPVPAFHGIFANNTGWSASKDNRTWIAREKDLVNSLEKALHPIGGIRRIMSGRPKVLVKPVMAYNQPPGTGYNTDPVLVKNLIEWCYKAGAREVSVLDQTRDEWTQTYKNSGIERVAKDAAARVYPANDERYYSMPESVPDKNLLVHNALVNADIIINLPVVVMPHGEKVKGAIDNYLGLVWERDKCIGSRQSSCIASLLGYKAPQLTIAEIWPENKQSELSTLDNELRYISVSDDIVLSDQASANILGLDYNQVSGVKEAILAGLGQQNPMPEQIIKV